MKRAPRIWIAVAACALAATVASGGSKVRKLEPREVAEIQASGKTVVFLDTRRGESPNKIPGSIHLPPDRVEAWAETADKLAVYVAYCT
jgi:hypothetical protein